MESRNEGLISKTVRPSNARKKALTTALKVCHLLLQNLNLRINNINSWLNSLHKEGSGNLTEMIQNKLHSKTHTNKLINRGSPLQDPFGGDSVDKVMLNVVHHAPQHPQEVVSSKTIKAESLHKVTTAAIDNRQVRNTILKDSEAIEIYKRRPRTPKLCKAEVIDLRLVKTGKKCCSFTHRIQKCGRTAVHLKLRRSNREWTYQESTRHESRSCGLKRTDL